MANTSPVVHDFSDVPPDGFMIKRMLEKKAISRDAENWYSITLNGKNVAYACCIEHAKKGVALVSYLHHTVDDSIMYHSLKPTQAGGLKMDYSSVSCIFDCKWRVA